MRREICMGKTALAMNIAEHVALFEDKPVAVFSQEMSSQQLVQRLLCSRAKVNLQRMRNGFPSERDFPNLTAIASRLATAKLFTEVDKDSVLLYGCQRDSLLLFERQHRYRQH